MFNLGVSQRGLFPLVFIAPFDTKFFMSTPKGTKKGYVDPSTLVPESGTFNPYDYLSSENYRNTRRGQMMYNEDLAQLNYLAQLRQQDFQNEYNSPAEQAARLRAAGLNPDFQQLSSESSAVGPTDAPSPMSGIKTNGDVASDVIGLIFSTAEVAFGIASGGLSLVGTGLDNASKMLNLSDNVLNFFRSNYDSQESDVSAPSLPFLSRRVQKRLDKLYSNWHGSLDFKRTNRSKSVETMRSKADFYKHLVDPLYNQDSFDDYLKAWKPVVDALNDYTLSQLKNNKKISDFGVFEADFKKENYEKMRFLRKPLMEVLNNMRDYPYLRAITSAGILKYLSNF